jgi:tetratricopeptide (TPR) repeat protein/predicted Ser/Thr protein kinase
MGTVYRAYDPTLKREVALKVLERGQHARLEREAQAAARLKHPNIVTLYELGQHDGAPFLSMELVEGAKLEDAWKDWPLRRRLEAIEVVARAMGHAHRQGVAHRDLKPQNVMVTPQGDVKIMDLGLARVEGESKLTRTGAVMGTPAYMAPEQVAGDPAGPPADVYALGVTLYEALTGDVPFTGERPEELYAKILRADPRPPRVVVPDVPRDVEVICLRAMERLPAHRYATVDDLADDLRRWLEGEPILARPPGAAFRARRWITRHPTALVASAAVMLGATAWVVVAWRGRVRVREEARAAWARGDWSRAVVESERAPADPEMRRIARASRLARAVEDGVREAEPLMYVAGNPRPKLDELEARLHELESLVGSDAPAALWSIVGAGWYFAGDAERAEPALARAPPDDGRANFCLARICLDRSMAGLGRRGGLPLDGSAARRFGDRALEIMRRPIAAWPGAEEVHRDVALVYRLFAEGRGKEALAACDEGARRFGDVPGAEEYAYVSGCLLHAAGDPAKARDSFLRALRIRPHFPAAALVCGNVRLDLGDAAGAVADFDAVLRMRPRSTDALVDRAAARYVQGRFDDAITDLDAAIALAPSRADAWGNRGAAHLARNDLVRALSDFDEAIRLDATLDAVHSARGAARFRSGDEAGGMTDFEKAIELNPREPGNFTNRGLGHWKRGDIGRAIEDYEKALRIAPKGWPGRAEAERALRELRK